MPPHKQPQHHTATIETTTMPHNSHRITDNATMYVQPPSYLKPTIKMPAPEFSLGGGRLGGPMGVGGGCQTPPPPPPPGVEAGSHGRSGEAPPLGDKGAWTRMVAKSRRRQGDGVQHVQRSAEHKGATRNAPWHGLGLEARGTETGRQATRDPKGRATLSREKEEERKSKKPDGKEILTPSTQLSWGREDPPATETYTGEPRPPVIQQQGTTMWSEVRLWTGLRTPLPNGNGAAVSIGCARATTTRSELSRRRSRGPGQTPGRGKATPALFRPGW